MSIIEEAKLISERYSTGIGTGHEEEKNFLKELSENR